MPIVTGEKEWLVFFFQNPHVAIIYPLLFEVLERHELLFVYSLYRLLLSSSLSSSLPPSTHHTPHVPVSS